MYPEHGDDVETLVRNADAAMYRAKEDGGGNFHLYTEDLNVAAVERMMLESSLRKGIERDELLVYYQPRVDVRTENILGTEALVRWRHPELGLVMPNQFIPLAEETGLIAPITEKVLLAACMQNKSWQDMGLPPIDVNVNISAREFQLEDLLGTVTWALDQSGLDPHYLGLELTESCLMVNPDHAVHVLCELGNMGIRISMDDFGTGYSSLSHLKKFPIHSVKIDKSFVRDITVDPDDAAIARATVAMAHSLKLKVVAEGVETIEQLDFLRSLDCDEMQGYFISKPVPAEELMELLDPTRTKQQIERSVA
jgi:EAL domain-containing protein (putative c-di-GMP-specific phosphodiesterase class I)